MNKLSLKIKSSLTTLNQKDYEMVSFKPTLKQDVMIKILAAISKESVAGLLTENISEKLASLLLNDISNCKLIEDLIEGDPNLVKGGCLKVLMDKNVIKQRPLTREDL